MLVNELVKEIKVDKQKALCLAAENETKLIRRSVINA
jgi:hypothetical protein